MSILRAYVSPQQSTPQKFLLLNSKESHHLIRVRRAQPGQLVQVFDGCGNEWKCQLEQADPTATRLCILSHHTVPLPPFSITLGQALPKGKAWESIITKATELGISSLVPLGSTHSEIPIATVQEVSKLQKWQALGIEACKQCGMSILPRISRPQNFDHFIETLPKQGIKGTLKLIASLENDAVSLRSVFADPTSFDLQIPLEAFWLIGPEGDFSPEEYSRARNHGFIPIDLGPNILRVDTAAIVALSLLLYELREYYKVAKK